MTGKYIPAAKEDVYELLRKAKEGDGEAREELVCRNIGLVKKLALKFTGNGYELDDLLQVGFIGLLKAVDRFDPSFDVMFSTYAVPMVLGELKRYLRDDGRIKMGRQMKQNVRTAKALREEFSKNHGRPPKISELAECMGVSAEEIGLILEAEDAMWNMESLDDPESTAAYTGDDFYQEKEERRADLIQLKSMIGKLEERDRQIIVLRYFKDMTQQEIAGRLGISQVQVSRIEKRILSGLREKMTAD